MNCSAEAAGSTDNSARLAAKKNEKKIELKLVLCNRFVILTGQRLGAMIYRIVAARDILHRLVNDQLMALDSCPASTWRPALPRKRSLRHR